MKIELEPAAYGSWDLGGSDESGHADTVRLVATAAPWRRLFARLDEFGVDRSDDPVSPEDEADAILACCWRYGSFAAVLCGGFTYSPFEGGRTQTLGRIGDQEMRRINIEFSAGVAEWLVTRESRPDVVRRRVRASRLHLPMPWRPRGRPSWYEEVEDSVARRSAASLTQGIADLAMSPTDVPVLTPRREANLLVNSAYRNGPVEDIHADAFGRRPDWERLASLGRLGTDVPGYRRLYAHDIRRVAVPAARKVARYLRLRPLVAGSSRDGVLSVALGWFGTEDWALSEETADITYRGSGLDRPMSEHVELLLPPWPRA